MNWRSRKPEEHSIGEGFFDGAQHFSEYVSVCFINDENNPLIPNQFNIVGIIAVVFLNAAHLLNGSDDQRIGRIVTFQFCYQNIGIFCVLYRTRIVGKTTVIHQ